MSTEHVKPHDGTALYGPLTHYGVSERPVRKCFLCSSRESFTVVTVDALDEHAAIHERAYAANSKFA